MLTRLESVFGQLHSQSCSAFIFLPILFKCAFVRTGTVFVNVAVLSIWCGFWNYMYTQALYCYYIVFVGMCVLCWLFRTLTLLRRFLFLLLVSVHLTSQSLPITWCTNSLTFNNCAFCPPCIYVFCIYLRTKSDLCHLQHKLIGFYNRDEKCLLRGTNWVFN